MVKVDYDTLDYYGAEYTFLPEGRVRLSWWGRDSVWMNESDVPERFRDMVVCGRGFYEAINPGPEELARVAKVNELVAAMGRACRKNFGRMVMEVLEGE